jgi:hypothetical protein
MDGGAGLGNEASAMSEFIVDPLSSGRVKLRLRLVCMEEVSASSVVV